MRSGATAEIPDLGAILRALANGRRREILDVLSASNRTMSIIEVSRTVGMDRLTVSRHLGVLRSAGLVTERGVGRKRMHAIDRGAFDGVADWVLDIAERHE